MNSLLMLHHRLVSGMMDGLPSGYVGCEYIENSSTAYIDTQYIPNNQTKIQIDTSVSKVAVAGFIYGVDAGWIQSSYSLPIKSLTQFWHCFNNEKQELHDLPLGFSFANKNLIVEDKGKLFVNGTLVDSIETLDFTAQNSLVLFACKNADGTIRQPLSAAKIFDCKIWENDILKRDYVPCLEIGSGLYGLYDKVEQKFYKSPNGTPFRGVKDFEDKYTICDYIENISTAYINTMYKPTNNTKVECEYEGMANNVNNWGAVFGSRTSGFNSALTVLVNISAPYNLLTAYGNLSGNDKYQHLTDIRFIGKHHILFDRNVNTIDNQVFNHAPSNFVSNQDMLIFGINEMGNNTYFVKMRLYKFKIYENGLVRDYVPCMEKSTGDYGLYDKVSKQFFKSPNGVKFVGA